MTDERREEFTAQLEITHRDGRFRVSWILAMDSEGRSGRPADQRTVTPGDALIIAKHIGEIEFAVLRAIREDAEFARRRYEGNLKAQETALDAVVTAHQEMVEAETLARQLAPEPEEGACDHEWVRTNSLRASTGEVCIKCLAMRAGNHRDTGERRGSS